MTLPLIELYGPPAQQGAQHGEALREPIAHNLAIYFERFERELGLSRAETLARAERYAAAVAAQSPAYHAAMGGVAAGSGQPLAAIAALNVRYELFYDEFREIARPDGCTAFAVLPEAAADGHLRIGENWDWIAGVRGAVLRCLDPDGHRSLAFSEAGIIGGKIGLSSAGIGLAINGLTSGEDDWSRLRAPFHLRCYQILRARSLDEAVAAVTASDRSCSANFLIAQAPDRVVNIESAPHTTALTGCTQGCLVHANHFVDPAALGISERNIEKSPHSQRRHERMASLLRARRPLDAGALQEILRDHQGHPYSVCFHIDPQEPPEEHYESVASAIIDLHEGALYLTDGPPCQDDYRRYAL